MNLLSAPPPHAFLDPCRGRPHLLARRLIVASVDRDHIRNLLRPVRGDVVVHLRVGHDNNKMVGDGGSSAALICQRHTQEHIKSDAHLDGFIHTCALQTCHDVQAVPYGPGDDDGGP